MLDIILPANPRKNTYFRIKMHSRPIYKIRYLFALHKTHPHYLKHGENLLGILDMIEGLEYHIKRLKIMRKLGIN